MKEKMLEIAKSYLNARQYGAGHKQIIDGYNRISPLPRGYRVKYTDNWCATFVSYVMHKAGYKGPFECSANRLREAMKKAGYQISDIGDAGDIIFYDWNSDGWSDHVGIIISYNNGMYKVIEGNHMHAVGYRTISKNSDNIQGIFRLPGDEKKTEKKTETKTETKTAAKRITKKLINDVIAGKYGNGKERVEKLRKAGYDPDKVQKEVNKAL